MLQFQTVESATLDLLKKISGQPLFASHRIENLQPTNQQLLLFELKTV
jgi:hypothetical protein